LLAVRAELERVARRMRARDAYLVELERAFDASNRQLESGRLRTATDTARLLGRVRGQAYRIAELEGELRQAIVALATERASTGSRDVPNQADLQLVRGIGPRFEAQLRAMGIATLANVAGWSAEDVARVAEQLNIRPQRIERDAWVDQARALSAGRK
jgi:NADH-quinone oxidoreductase subunit E